jgi:hypothetical protein
MGAGQEAEWSALLAPQITRQLDEPGGPDLGSLGFSFQFFRRGADARWAWGGSAALHRLGTFEAPDVPDRDMRAWTAGVRALRGSLERGPHVSFGVDLLLLQEAAGGVDWSTDPGVAGYAGVGWSHRTTPGGGGVFGELGLTGALASGESTKGGGVYLSVRVGLIVQ